VRTRVEAGSFEGGSRLVEQRARLGRVAGGFQEAFHGVHAESNGFHVERGHGTAKKGGESRLSPFCASGNLIPAQHIYQEEIPIKASPGISVQIKSFQNASILDLTPSLTFSSHC
jgi:hypothetical protein